MQLFRSEWMFEPAPRAGALDLQRPRFALRYGAGRTAVRPVCPPLSEFDATPALASIERERDVLRRLAEYDRAA